MNKYIIQSVAIQRGFPFLTILFVRRTAGKMDAESKKKKKYRKK